MLLLELEARYIPSYVLEFTTLLMNVLLLEMVKCMPISFELAELFAIVLFEEYPDSKRWPVPKGKDPGDYFKNHKGNIREWIIAGLPRALRPAAQEIKNGNEKNEKKDNNENNNAEKEESTCKEKGCGKEESNGKEEANSE